MPADVYFRAVMRLSDDVEIHVVSNCMHLDLGYSVYKPYSLRIFLTNPTIVSTAAFASRAETESVLCTNLLRKFSHSRSE